jgi:hypothetical protein
MEEYICEDENYKDERKKGQQQTKTLTERKLQHDNINML